MKHISLRTLGGVAALVLALALGFTFPTETRASGRHCHLYSGGIACDGQCQGLEICCNWSTDCYQD